MKILFYTLCVTILVLGSTRAQESSEMQIIVNADIRTQVSINDQVIEMSGRLSTSLKSPEDDLAQGLVHIGGLNVVYFGVPMEPFLGPDQTTGKTTGAVGITLDMSERQHLRIVPASTSGEVVLEGELRGVVELSKLGDLIQLPIGNEEHTFTAPTQRAKIIFRMVVDESVLKPGNGAGRDENGILSLKGEMLFAFDAEELGLREVKVPSYSVINPELVPVEFQLTWLPFEAVRRLCVQPVRVGVITIERGWPVPIFSVTLTGEGLAFGQPGANTQWRKADVIFEWRDWKTVWKSQYFTLDIAANEDADLRAEVNDDDCIEVFFVDTFDVPSTWGGGATFSSGLTSAKVISSDDNAGPICTSGAACNITHLAHEFGHVMTLAHPGSGGIPAHMVDGTSGTLMCPSGFTADNPRVNSSDNEANVNNPLFRFAFTSVGPAPDCTNNTDCGSCFTGDP